MPFSSCIHSLLILSVVILPNSWSQIRFWSALNVAIFFSFVLVRRFNRFYFFFLNKNSLHSYHFNRLWHSDYHFLEQKNFFLRQGYIFCFLECNNDECQFQEKVVSYRAEFEKRIVADQQLLDFFFIKSF